jgi:ElaB/YqjD/DUF883 family membrane-anchored ribosome-binding protein
MFTQKKVRIVLAVLVFVVVVFMTGCGGAYKASGQYKRDLLLNRIEKAKQCHERAKNQFEVVLANYADIIDANAGDIRTEYNKLNRECKRARKIAKEISQRVKDVEDIGKPMFRNWEDELAEYNNEAIRRSSEEQLDLTRRNYLKCVHSIKSCQGKVEGVLASLNDQMLFLSHNLNSKALSAFKKNTASLKSEVGALVKQMQAGIKEAETFIDENGSVALTKPEEK